MLGTIPWTEMLLRLGVAAALGLLLGLDRELRGAPAGLRTHALISLGSAAVMVSGLLLYAEVRVAGGDADPLRVAQGIFQAIGFIGVGLVFVAKGDVHNLTTAANIVLAAGVGIAAGAGQYELAVVASALGLAILTLLRVVERLVPGTGKREEEGPPSA